MCRYSTAICQCSISRGSLSAERASLCRQAFDRSRSSAGLCRDYPGSCVESVAVVLCMTFSLRNSPERDVCDKQQLPHFVSPQTEADSFFMLQKCRSHVPDRTETARKVSPDCAFSSKREQKSVKATEQGLTPVAVKGQMFRKPETPLSRRSARRPRSRCRELGRCEGLGRSVFSARLVVLPCEFGV